MLDKGRGGYQGIVTIRGCFGGIGYKATELRSINNLRWCCAGICLNSYWGNSQFTQSEPSVILPGSKIADSLKVGDTHKKGSQRHQPTKT